MQTLGIVKLVSMTAEAVARIGHRAFREGRVVCITGVRNKIPACLTRLFPRAMVRKVTKRLNNVRYD